MTQSAITVLIWLPIVGFVLFVLASNIFGSNEAKEKENEEEAREKERLEKERKDFIEEYGHYALMLREQDPEIFEKYKGSFNSKKKRIQQRQAEARKRIRIYRVK